MENEFNVKTLGLKSCLVSFLCSDRFRTMVNVMGDALATGIMAHICRKDFIKEGDGVSFLGLHSSSAT